MAGTQSPDPEHTHTRARLESSLAPKVTPRGPLWVSDPSPSQKPAAKTPQLVEPREKTGVVSGLESRGAGVLSGLAFLTSHLSGPEVSRC